MRRGCKCTPDDSILIEKVLTAFSDQDGGLNIKSASQMSKALPFFLSEAEMVDKLIRHRLIINNMYVPVFLLYGVSEKIVLSNMPPFIKN